MENSSTILSTEFDLMKKKQWYIFDKYLVLLDTVILSISVIET
jgi:hypothetical protein